MVHEGSREIYWTFISRICRNVSGTRNPSPVLELASEWTTRPPAWDACGAFDARLMGLRVNA